MVSKNSTKYSTFNILNIPPCQKHITFLSKYIYRKLTKPNFSTNELFYYIRLGPAISDGNVNK